MSKHIEVPINKPAQFEVADAELVAKQAHINRFIHTDFGWAPVSRKIMLDLLALVRQDVKVEIMKEHKFAIYYFSLP